MENTTITEEQIARIKAEFAAEMRKPYIRCDLGGSLAELVQDALAIALRRIAAES